MKTMKKIVAIMAVALMLCSILPLSVFAADTYELASSIAAGDTVVLVCTSAKKELSGISTTSTKYGLGVAYSSTPAGAYVLTVEAGSTSGTYSFKCSNGQYLYWSSGNSLATNATKNANTSWKVTFSGTNVTIVNAKDNSRKLQWNNSSPRFACYTSSQTAIQLFKKVVSEPEVPSTCDHDWELISSTAATCTATGTENYECAACGETKTDTIAALGHKYVEDVIDATCTATGTKTYECSVCFNSYDETIPMKAHTWVDGFCSVCGEEKPLNATIDFSTNGQRVEFSTNSQKWENDGLVLINNKTADSNAVGDYTNPIRIYKSSEIVIEFSNMTSLVIDAAGIKSDYAWTATLEASGYTYSVADGIYTITFAEPTDSITLIAANQVRANSITAYGVKVCKHTYDHEFDVDCNDCEEIREVATYIVGGGTSISEDVNGVAAKFTVAVDGLAVAEGTTNVADYTNATIGGYKLITMGVIASNGTSQANITCKYLMELEDGSAVFAARIKNIPEKGYGVEITFQSYFVVEIDGEQVTIYGAEQIGAYNG